MFKGNPPRLITPFTFTVTLSHFLYVVFLSFKILIYKLIFISNRFVCDGITKNSLAYSLYDVTSVSHYFIFNSVGGLLFRIALDVTLINKREGHFTDKQLIYKIPRTILYFNQFRTATESKNVDSLLRSETTCHWFGLIPYCPAYWKLSFAVYSSQLCCCSL